MAGPDRIRSVQPVLEALEARLLLDARPVAEVLAALPAGAAYDATERFNWTGFLPGQGELPAGGMADLAGPPVEAATPTTAYATLEYRFTGQVRMEGLGGGFTVSLDGEELWVQEGDPLVPVRHSQILLPPGYEILWAEVELGAGVVAAEGVELVAADEPAPADGGGQEGGAAAMRLAQSAFPAGQAVTFSTQMMCGYAIGLLEIFPVSYDPSTGTVMSYPDVTVHLTMGQVGVGSVPLRDSAEDLERVLAAVDNDSAALDYAAVVACGEAGMPTAGLLPAGGPYEYVIVTSSALAGEFERLAEDKRSRGLTATVVSTTYINSQFISPYANENDNAGKLRQFLAEAYAGWGTRYVLLGGDISQVAYRQVRVICGSYDLNLSTDMYFACLDGPYNGDGDTSWGEVTDGTGGGEVDLLAELAVGRAPVDTAAEVQNFIRKTILYETTPPPDPLTAVMIGENLSSTDPITWGGDSCDYIVQQVFPAEIEITRLYAEDGTFSGTAVRNALNAGPHLVHHVGHATQTSNAGLSRTDVDNLTNAYPYILYSQGCLSGQFDYNDSIGEHHVKDPYGAVAVVMNTNYGWYAPGVPSASGTQWGLAFWDALFTENILPLGDMHMDAKRDLAGTVGSQDSDRWLFFASNLLGDPELHVYMPRSGGARVLSQEAPEAGEAAPILRLRFNEPMDTSSFALEQDLVSFTGPGGMDFRGRVAGYIWRDFYTLDVLFSGPLAFGPYELVLGPGLLDSSGTALDQDSDGTPGEAQQDAYRAAFTIPGAGSTRGVFYSADMEQDPLWTLSPGSGDYAWGWGVPTGAAGDPTAGHTGTRVVGYNLNGAYPNNLNPPQYATMPPIDCRGFQQVTLSFWRWLRVHAAPFDYAKVEVSLDGTTWQEVWTNTTGIYETAWTQQTIDISAIADGQPAVRIRWAMGPTNASITYGGWNLDDVTLTGSMAYPAVLSQAPAGQAAAGLDHVDVSFSAPLDGATLTAEDISLEGPAGAVAITEVQALSPSTYRLSFAGQDVLGTYTLRVGPEVCNRIGAAMDQDGDQAPGEAGEDAYVGTFQIIPPDADGPAVLSHSPSGPVIVPPTTVRFSFDEDMDTGSFSVGDVASFAGPGGTDLRSKITGYQWLDARTLEVRIAPQSLAGVYRMVIGPGILDDAPGGNPMDQDGNGTPGEPTDGYTAEFGLVEIDLLGESFALSPESLDSGGGTTRATFRIANAGPSAAGPFKVRFYLSDDAIIEPARDILLSLAGGEDAFAVAGLAGGAKLSTFVQLAVPGTDPLATDNSYYIGMVIDADGEVGEITEINNASRGAGLDLARAYYGRLFGKVVEDVDGDGVVEAGEPAMAGRTVYLDVDGNGVRDTGEPTASTGSDGKFIFRYLADGPYTVRVDLPTGWIRTYPAATDGYDVTLVTGGIAENLDFGLCRPTTVIGAVYEDTDLDGQRDVGEPPAGGQMVYLDLNANGAREADEPIHQTGADGAYAFDGLRPGSYVVRHVLEAGWFRTAPATGQCTVNLTSGATVSDQDFGLVAYASLRPADVPPYPAAGLEYAFYHQTGLASVAGLDGLPVLYTGVVSGFDVSQRDREIDYGFIYRGFVNVDQDGIYTFYTSSDDGSRLYVGDRLTVDNDGVHTAQERSGRVALRAGMHAITLKYIQGAAPQALAVQYEGPGVARASVPAGRLFYNRPPDTTPPQLGQVQVQDATHLTAVFSERLEDASARTAANYYLNHGGTVVAAALAVDGVTVTLTLGAALMVDLPYTLTVSDVRDLQGNPVPAGTQADLVYHWVDPTLLTWWTFDQQNGSTAVDATGNGRDGIISGPEWTAAGLIGGALRLHGGSDKVEDADGELYINGLSAVTIALWVKGDPAVIGSDAGVFTTRVPGNSSGLNLRYDTEGNYGKAPQTLKGYLYTTSGNRQYEGEAYSHSTQWQHLAITWTSGGRMAIYRDGRLQTLTYDSGAIAGTLSQATTLIIGQACKNVGWTGLMDDFRLYNRQLTAQEIAALANLEPVAVEDVYNVDEGGVLDVPPAEGVLANDTDPDAKPAALTAALCDAPAHGQVTLNSNGSFQYRPAAGYIGTDSFTYLAYDGLEYGKLAAVAIHVIPPAPTVVGLVRNDGADRPSRLTALALRFSQDVSGSLTAEDLRIRNLSTSQDLDLTGATIAYDPATNAARWDLSGVAISAGYHLVSLPSEAVTNAGGRPLAGGQDGGYQVTILVALGGDANLDGQVGREDLLALKPQLGQAATGWAGGDFDYDGTVSVLDYLTLKSNYGKVLAIESPEEPAAGDIAPTDAEASGGVSAEAPAMAAAELPAEAAPQPLAAAEADTPPSAACLGPVVVPEPAAPMAILSPPPVVLPARPARAQMMAASLSAALRVRPPGKMPFGPLPCPPAAPHILAAREPANADALGSAAPAAILSADKVSTSVLSVSVWPVPGHPLRSRLGRPGALPVAFGPSWHVPGG